MSSATDDGRDSEGYSTTTSATGLSLSVLHEGRSASVTIYISLHCYLPGSVSDEGAIKSWDIPRTFLDHIKWNLWQAIDSSNK